MPFAVSRSDAPSKMYALRSADGLDFFWTAARSKAAQFTSDEADKFVEEFAKYSDIELDIEGIKAVEPTPVEAQAA